MISLVQDIFLLLLGTVGIVVLGSLLYAIYDTIKKEIDNNG